MIEAHYDELLTLYPKERIFFIALQGSQNYDLAYEGSDIDTKALIIPTLAGAQRYYYLSGRGHF